MMFLGVMGPNEKLNSSNLHLFKISFYEFQQIDLNLRLIDRLTLDGCVFSTVLAKIASKCHINSLYIEMAHNAALLCYIQCYLKVKANYNGFNLILIVLVQWNSVNHYTTKVLVLIVRWSRRTSQSRMLRTVFDHLDVVKGL